MRSKHRLREKHSIRKSTKISKWKKGGGGVNPGAREW